MSSQAMVRPLSGSGIVVRTGDLLMVCADEGAGVDELLSAFSEVAAAGYDGAVLVRRIAALLASDESDRFPACAVSGPAADGRVAVLVHGDATAGVMGGEGPVVLSGTDAITSVNRLVAGPVTEVRLQLPGAGNADPRARLDSGVVLGAGVVFHPQPAEAAPPEAAAPAWEPEAAAPAGEPEAAAVPPEPEIYSVPANPVTVLPADSWTPQPPEAPQPREAPQPLEAPQPAEAAEAVGTGPTPAESVGAAPEAAESVGSAPGPVQESRPVAESWGYSSMAAESVGAAPEAAESVRSAPSPVQETRPVAESWGYAPAPADSFDGASTPAEAVGGAPAASESVGSAPTAVSEEPPSAGVLVLDDGTTFRLDIDYVIGREPQHDPDVLSGTARAMKIEDAEGVVSRKHLRVGVAGTAVSVIDLGSSNGTFVQLPDDPQKFQLVVGQPATIPPGTTVSLGRRWLRYEADLNP